MSQHPALFTWLLATVTWAALFGVLWLSRSPYRQRPSVPATESGEPDEVDVELSEFITDTPEFDSAYAVSPAAGDEQ